MKSLFLFGLSLLVLSPLLITESNAEQKFKPLTHHFQFVPVNLVRSSTVLGLKIGSGAAQRAICSTGESVAACNYVPGQTKLGWRSYRTEETLAESNEKFLGLKVMGCIAQDFADMGQVGCAYKGCGEYTRPIIMVCDAPR